MPYFSQYERTRSFPAVLCMNGTQVPDLIAVLRLTPQTRERVSTYLCLTNSAYGSDVISVLSVMLYSFLILFCREVPG